MEISASRFSRIRIICWIRNAKREKTKESRMHFLLVALLALSVARLIGSSSSWRYESGTCEKLVSYTASRYAPYQETYKVRKWGIFYETKVRWNYKKEYYTAYGKKMVCCADYRMTDMGDCEPICDPDCVNGECVAPDTCRCFADYTRSETRDRVCEPICTDCVHGTCKEPNVCVCDDGYKRNENGTVCEPICDVDCEKGHAYCSAPRVCTCHSGYAPASNYTSENKICEPVCDIECANGDCVEPNVCACHDGYEPNPRDKFSCEPRCKDGCLFGACTAPDICTCEPGYRSNNRSRANVCEPICSEPCTMGTCVAPETCSCADGYGLLGQSRYVCEPICQENCVHGYCAQPNVCECQPGYRASSNDSSVCEPFCERCSNGRCVAPADCRCDPGFVKENDADADCVAACATNCSGHGTCLVSNRSCDCFYGWHGTDCEEPLFCILRVDRGIGHSNASNIVYRANETIDFVFASSPLCDYDCYDENESSCYRTYSDDHAGNDTITCLISTDFDCRTVPAEYTRQVNYIIPIGIAGITTISTACVAAIYSLTRKRAARRFLLDD